MKWMIEATPGSYLSRATRVHAAHNITLPRQFMFDQAIFNQKQMTKNIFFAFGYLWTGQAKSGTGFPSIVSPFLFLIN